jgi:molybdopterin molybdotransferase
MISVGEAVHRITSAFSVLDSESVPLTGAAGRILSSDVRARQGQPPAAVSSMDGYAVRAADAAKPGAKLQVVGAAPAGHPFPGSLGPGQAIRIFTGAIVPGGSDAIVIQEDAVAEHDKVTLNSAAIAGRHIRPAGLDFKSGEVIARAGRRLTPRDVALIAAGDVAAVTVRRRPKIAFAATGDELSLPGAPRKPGGIVASSGFGLAALIERWGGVAIDLGILPDTHEAVASIADRSKVSDLIVTIGGASVGEHDLVQKALGPRGFELDFWKIAMRPGKPLIFGRLGRTPLLGLPGNPVSTLVCGLLFLRPAISAMLGTTDNEGAMTARLSTALKANDGRQDYVRASMEVRDGERWVNPFPIQDSSMLSALAAADVLVVRPPYAPIAEIGERVSVLSLD